MTQPRPTPRWVALLRTWSRQTSSRSGLTFVMLSGAGMTLTDEEAAVVMALAGAVAAVIALLFPDRADS
jgi:uncharacterized membrane protein